MSLLVTLNGSNYIIPETNEVGWGSNLDDYFVAIAAGVLQKTGGSFTLSAETDFGASYGLKSLYLKSRSSNVASTGIVRLANNSDAISWRNFANGADLALTVDASNRLSFNGTPIQPNTLTDAHILVGNASNIATDVAVTGDIGITNAGVTSISSGVIVNADVNTSAAIAYSKLNLSGSIVNADVNASAAIAYSKLTLTGSIVNADINTSAAIAYSKLSLSLSIVNADINGSAAIAYSKLNLSGSIVNADIGASAAIAYSKLNLATSIVNADVSASAAIVYSKLSLTGSILNADINASAAIAYSKLNLATSIVNADISASAAIAITKIANGTANQVLGTNNGASANEWKTLTSTSNQVTVTHGVGTVTFSTPQDIATSSAVRFGSLTLGGALDTSSILSLTSTTKGFLPPVMTTTQKNAISTPTDGLIVFDSSLAQLYLRTGGAWTSLSTGGGSGTVSAGTQYQLGYYATSSTTMSGNSGIVTDASNNLAISRSAASADVTTTIENTENVSGTSRAKLLIQAGGTSGGDAFVQYRIPSGSTWSVGVDNSATDNFVFSLSTSIGSSNVLECRSSGDVVVPLSDLYVSRTSSGGTVFMQIENGSNTASSHAKMLMTSGGSSGGNPYMQFHTPSGTIVDWSIGQDNAASGNFKISKSSNVGTNDAVIITTSGAVAIKGSSTNDSATAGFVGEVISSVASDTAYPSTGVYGDLTSVSLTAGDWLVSAVLDILGNGATVTSRITGISTTSGNSSTGLVNGDSSVTCVQTFTTFTGAIGSDSIPFYRISLSGSSTVYLKYEAAFSVATPHAVGRLTALRIR